MPHKHVGDQIHRIDATTVAFMRFIGDKVLRRADDFRAWPKGNTVPKGRFPDTMNLYFDKLLSAK